MFSIDENVISISDNSNFVKQVGCIISLCWIFSSSTHESNGIDFNWVRSCSLIDESLN